MTPHLKEVISRPSAPNPAMAAILLRTKANTPCVACEALHHSALISNHPFPISSVSQTRAQCRGFAFAPLLETQGSPRAFLPPSLHISSKPPYL